MSKIRALVIDDSAMMRQLLKGMLDSDPEIEVVGTAMDPYIAREKIKRLNPDVLTLDIEMPKMDGLSFLKNLMRLRPMPVVMISTLTKKGASETMRALELGAFDVVAKPTNDAANALGDYREEIVEKVKAAARAQVHRLKPVEALPETVVNDKAGDSADVSSAITAIGASTGGTEAIKEVLMGLGPASPGVVVAQHIPPVFSASFAKRLDQCTPLNVWEARDGEPVLNGHAYIAPGGKHLEIRSTEKGWLCVVTDGEPVNRHKPSVDVLFDSVATHAGDKAKGVMLSGMGDDGASGMSNMHKAGARTIAQDEDTSVVWGMPGSAVAAGGVDEILPIGEIAARLKAG